MNRSVNGRDLVLLAHACKELQISISISIQAGFIGDLFPWKRTGRVRVEGGGGERHRFKAKQDSESKGG